MSFIPDHCERCGKQAPIGVIVSKFNREWICVDDCKTKERQHPDYEKASLAEHQQVMQGNHDFPGIGKPADL